MANWFECKVRYDKMMENGLQKKVNEPYMVDALSFTEAEARIIEELTPFISGDFSVGTGWRDSRVSVYLAVIEDPFHLKFRTHLLQDSSNHGPVPFRHEVGVGPGICDHALLIQVLRSLQCPLR